MPVVFPAVALRHSLAVRPMFRRFPDVRLRMGKKHPSWLVHAIDAFCQVDREIHKRRSTLVVTILRTDNHLQVFSLLLGAL
jgi:hypothetical protein